MGIRGRTALFNLQVGAKHTRNLRPPLRSIFLCGGEGSMEVLSSTTRVGVAEQPMKDLPPLLKLQQISFRLTPLLFLLHPG